MLPLLSIIMPAYRAHSSIVESVRSALMDAPERVELMIISDDETDYDALLRREGVATNQINFLSTGSVAAGSALARNVGLAAAQGDYVAVLDADDLFLPGKISALRQGLSEHGFVSTALKIEKDGQLLRLVGEGENVLLSAHTYKHTNLSMDSMIAYDRKYGDPRYDEKMNCLTDLDLIMKLFGHHQHCWHIGRPLHVYRKQSVSISMGPNASSRYKIMKRELIERLKHGEYSMIEATGPTGFVDFLTCSLQAEEQFAAALRENEHLIFEDHLSSFLRV